MSVFRDIFDAVPPPKYQAALQHPDKVFKDPQLQRARVEMKDGIPKYRSGGYALVYRLASRDNPQHREDLIALRCFREPRPDLAQRYAKICEHLDRQAARSPFFVTTRFHAEGIRIDGAWKPVTTMAWIDGDYLDVFLDRASKEPGPHLMNWLESRIRALADELDRTGIAHGDLHYKNILVSSQRSGDHAFKLVDYDGMFVPSLAKLGPREPGHEDYQHPLRGDAFGPTLDVFSLMVLYLNIVAVKRHPELWDARRRVEGLLTREVDYLDPDGSETLRQLEEFPDLRQGVVAFKRTCLGSYAEIPSAKDFFARFQDAPATTAHPGAAIAPRADARPIGAEDTKPPTRWAAALPPLTRPPRSKAIRPILSDLQAREGQEVAVIGLLSRSVDGDGSVSSPCQTLHIQASGGATFEIMIDEDVAIQVLEYERDWTVTPGDWIWVRGLLLSDGRRFAIDLEQAANLAKVTQVDATHFTFYPELAEAMRKEAQAEALRRNRAVGPDTAVSVIRAAEAPPQRRGLTVPTRPRPVKPAPEGAVDTKPLRDFLGMRDRQ